MKIITSKKNFRQDYLLKVIIGWLEIYSYILRMAFQYLKQRNKYRNSRGIYFDNVVIV